MTTGKAWLGYTSDGGRAQATIRELGGRVLLLGQGSPDLSALLAYAFSEAGDKPTILDLDGSVSKRVSAHLPSYDYRSFLYAVFQLEDQDARLGQFIAAAYAAALDLSYEEEAILNSALQKLVAQDNTATPTVIFDALKDLEGFRGYYVDKLRGRIGALTLMDAAHANELDVLLAGGVLVDFSRAPYPQAGELSLALFIAQILAALLRTKGGLDPLMITGVHRLFKSAGRMMHGNRLLVHLLECQTPLVLSSGCPSLLSRSLTDSVPVRMYSSDAWNATGDRNGPAALPSSYVINDLRFKSRLAFVPRHVTFRTSPASSPTPYLELNKELAKQILEEVRSFEVPTRESMVSFLSVGRPRLDVEMELDKLYKLGYILQEPKKLDSGTTVLAYSLTGPGRQLLEELRR